MNYFDAFLLTIREELKQASPTVAETLRLVLEREIIRESERIAALREAGMTNELAPIQGEAVKAAIKSQENH